MNKPTAVVVGVGAERGLGAALCRRFAQGGYHVLVAGRTQVKIGRVAETIAAAGGSAEPIAMDATRELVTSRPDRTRLPATASVEFRSSPIRPGGATSYMR
jgi:NAD(P)-dependent dehydrogenase (short-subunit alcohol dehydrogenase family)